MLRTIGNNIMTYSGRPYTPVTPPSGDTDELAGRGDRLIFVHDRRDSHLVIAPRGMLHYGLVLGVFDLDAGSLC